MVNRPIEIDGVKYFKCKKCGEVKPLNKCYFHINTMFITGFNSKCKSCVKKERESKPKVKYITRAELEEENKNLKRELEDTKQVSERDYNIVQNDNNILRNENKKLKEELKYYKEKTDFLNNVIVKYQEEK